MPEPDMDPPASTMEAALAQAEREGDGVWTMQLHAVFDLPHYLRAAAAGDEAAANVCAAMGDVAGRIIQAAPDQSLICMCCDVEFPPGGELPSAVMMLSASVDAPNQYAISPLCQQCHQASDVRQRILAAVRKRLIPNARPIAIQPAERA